MGLDNGPDSTKMIQAELADCKTIIWNGPMGVFEFDKFAAGAFLAIIGNFSQFSVCAPALSAS